MRKKDIIIGIGIALFLAFFISPFASKSPDGLEKVAQTKGFIDKEKEPLFLTPFAGYQVKGIKSEKVSTPLAGVFGVILVFGAAYLTAKALKPKAKA